ncbi:MAG: cupin domain-containing protein [Thermomicrobia bacterium]|nr:cupin domain-containing protein [Thermomicrobia bacterium]
MIFPAGSSRHVSGISRAGRPRINARITCVGVVVCAERGHGARRATRRRRDLYGSALASLVRRRWGCHPRRRPSPIRQPHLHTNANELSYLATGQARVGLVGPGGEQHLFDLAAGEVAFQPMGWVHWLENTGDGPLFAVFMYSHEQPETIDLPDVLPSLPKQSGY